jgi:hypothetical protein
VTSLLAEVSGGSPLLVGFGTEKDNVHAIDESYSMDQFKSGFLFAGLMLQALAD